MQKSNVSGTCLQGKVFVSYVRLVAVFGEPHNRNGDKITVEWAFKHKGVKFTIYDYKWESLQNETMELFHVGGMSFEAVRIARELLGQ